MALVVTLKDLKVIKTKGRSVLVPLTDEKSLFILPEHVKQDKNTLFIVEDWQYSVCGSHYDEYNHEYVRDPIIMIKGQQVVDVLQRNGRVASIKMLERKAKKAEDIVDKSSF